MTWLTVDKSRVYVLQYISRIIKTLKRVSKSQEAPQRENVTQPDRRDSSEAWLEGSCAEGFEPALEFRMR